MLLPMKIVDDFVVPQRRQLYDVRASWDGEFLAI